MLHIIAGPGLPAGKPPSGMAVLYQLAPSASAVPVYLGQTKNAPRSRFYKHIWFARHFGGMNAQLEAWIRQRVVAGQPIFIRVVGLYPWGDAADAAERAAIADLRADLGSKLFNQGPGGEKAPAGRLVSREERQRAALSRRHRQRSAAFRAHQALVSSRRRHAPEVYDALLRDFAEAPLHVTALKISQRHGVSETALITLLRGHANGLVVRSDLLARARDAQTRRKAARRTESARVQQIIEAYLASPPATALADIARADGFSPKRIQGCLRRGQHGIPHDLARAALARMRQDVCLRAISLGRRRARINRVQLRWLLTAYSRPGSRLTLAAIAERLGATQGAVSHFIAGRGGRPLPRRLVRACKARAEAASRAALRAPVPPSGV
ncbi:hypothetical protein [Roseomonas chloroacetimidivorans]|uniref:hypothetical protein n=1 Tax=Roseomonas chloroacetimidivorans TaxID=1766656 RepID=UPI003C70B377